MNSSRFTAYYCILICTLMLSACAIPSAPVTDLQILPPEPITMTGSTESSASAESVATNTGSSVIDERLLPSGMAEVGAENAPVSIMLFTNTSCGYCRDFHEDLLPRLMNDYVRSGDVRIAVVPFIVHKYAQSEPAALAQLCATRQGRGMAMQDLLFRESVGTAAYRTGLGVMQIDQEQLTQCMEDPATRAVMDAHQAVAASLGVTLIPSYTINGELHTGLPDYPDLRGEIEEEMRMEN